MGRTERRRQQRVERRTPGDRLSPELQSLFAKAVSRHQARQFHDAETLYTQILQQHPHHADSLHLLGLTAYQTGNVARASQLITQAIQVTPSNPLFHYNMGLVYEKAGQLENAADAYRHAIDLNPSYVEAHSNLGTVLRLRGLWQDAIAAFQTALRVKPESAELQNNLGVVLRERGQLPEAIAAFRKALHVNPSHAEAHNNLGIALKDQGHLLDAAAAFEQALKHRPNYAKAHHHLGLTLLWQQHPEQALGCFEKSAALTHHHGQPVRIHAMTPARIKHDYEQMRYLSDRGLITEPPASYLETLTRLREEIRNMNAPGQVFSPTPCDLQALAPSFNRILYQGHADALPEGTLNPRLDVPTIEAAYLARQPETMFVDHLLNDAALSRLRAFCLESTIWKRDYQNGYLGTFLAEGFACPLLLQIAEDLRTRFPRIFGQHLLTQAWAFKHDSELQGLNLHADAAAVNVNFWITPDEANVDPDSGGLVVWNKEAPDEWDFKQYNSETSQEAIRTFIDTQRAQAITIPHRQNRAVIFNSNLFHKTDTLVFRDDYESRRINVTLLYGLRQKARRASL